MLLKIYSNYFLNTQYFESKEFRKLPVNLTRCCPLADFFSTTISLLSTPILYISFHAIFYRFSEDFEKESAFQTLIRLIMESHNVLSVNLFVAGVEREVESKFEDAHLKSMFLISWMKLDF